MTNESDCPKCGTSEHVVDDHRCSDHARKRNPIPINAVYENGVLVIEINKCGGWFGVIHCHANGEIELFDSPCDELRKDGNYQTVNAAIETALAWT